MATLGSLMDGKMLDTKLLRQRRSNLRVLGYDLPWEDALFDYPSNLESPLDIKVSASQWRKWQCPEGDHRTGRCGV